MGGYRAVIFRLFFVAKNHLHFYCQNLEKKTWFWEAKMTPKIEFFESWRALVSDLNFRSIFCQFFIDFSKLESLKIVLPPRRNAYFCKIAVLALSQKKRTKKRRFWSLKSIKNRLKSIKKIHAKNQWHFKTIFS